LIDEIVVLESLPEHFQIMILAKRGAEAVGTLAVRRKGDRPDGRQQRGMIPVILDALAPLVDRLGGRLLGGRVHRTLRAFVGFSKAVPDRLESVRRNAPPARALARLQHGFAEAFEDVADVVALRRFLLNQDETSAYRRESRAVDLVLVGVEQAVIGFDQHAAIPQQRKVLPGIAERRILDPVIVEHGPDQADETAQLLAGLAQRMHGFVLVTALAARALDRIVDQFHRESAHAVLNRRKIALETVSHDDFPWLQAPL